MKQNRTLGEKVMSIAKSRTPWVSKGGRLVIS